MTALTAWGTPSALPPALIAAYRRAIFGLSWMVTPQTDMPGYIEFALDQYLEPLDAIFEMTGHDTAALVTAFNPAGVATPAVENVARHDALVRDVAARGLPAAQAYGRDPDGDWPAEQSLLVSGLSFDDALALGQEYDQNAIVWSDGTFVPRLVLLR